MNQAPTSTPCSLVASSPGSCLQETRGICSSCGSLPFSKLSASDQSHLQPQSKPREVQVDLSVPQLAPVSLPPLVSSACHPAKTCLLSPLLGQNLSRARDQERGTVKMLATDYSCALQSVSLSVKQSVTDTPGISHTQNPAQAQHRQWHSAGQTSKWLSQAG